MNDTRVAESRALVYSACRRALDSYGEEPEPPLTGEAASIGSTYSYIKPLLETAGEARAADRTDALIDLTEEVVVESLFLLARVMEFNDLYSDSGMETPLTAACYYALGSYMEQEGEKEDHWRDREFEKLHRDALDELDIIRSNISDEDYNNLLRNTVDFVLLSGILFASVIDSQS